MEAKTLMLRTEPRDEKNNKAMERPRKCLLERSLWTKVELCDRV